MPASVLIPMVGAALAATLLFAGSASAAAPATGQPAGQPAGQTQDVAAAGALTHTVVDAQGNSVEIPNQIDSIVVPFPAAAQTVLGLGAADLLSGGFVLNTDMNAAMFPDVLSSITVIRPSDINSEVVMNCEPDFVVLASAKQAEALGDINIPVLLYATSSIEDLEKDCTMIAAAIGTDEAKDKAAFYTEFYEELEQTVSQMTAKIPEDEKPVVYVATADDPLTSIGSGTVVSNWVEVSGGIYAPTVLKMDGFDITLTAEQLVEADPDIIICTTKAGMDALLDNPAFKNVSAVASGKVYLNPMGGSVWFKAHFEAPLELAWAPTVIAPEQTAKLDTRSYVEEFYQAFYGYELTDEDYELIMNPPVGSA